MDLDYIFDYLPYLRKKLGNESYVFRYPIICTKKLYMSHCLTFFLSRGNRLMKYLWNSKILPILLLFWYLLVKYQVFYHFSTQNSIAHLLVVVKTLNSPKKYWALLSFRTLQTYGNTVFHSFMLKIKAYLLLFLASFQV